MIQNERDANQTPRDDDIGFLIKLIHDDIDRIINNQLRPLGLTSSQGVVLAYLMAHSDSRVTMREIQEILGVAHPTVVGLIRRLEKKDLVEVRVAPDDRRMRAVSLTDRARGMLTKIPPQTDLIESQLLDGLSAAERRELQRLLGILHRNVR